MHIDKKDTPSIFRRFGRNARLQYLAWMVRRGILPENVEQAELYEALRVTVPPNVMELFGFLRVRVYRKVGTLMREMYPDRLVSVRLVTIPFANYLVDSCADSTTYPLDAFSYYDMGDDATAESNAHTGMQNSRESRVSGNQQENGANIYQTIATITATASYDVEEHGLFSASTSGTLMDRNLVPSPPSVITDDQVQFTYELTVNAES